jgi:hypothetical protein
MTISGVNKTFFKRKVVFKWNSQDFCYFFFFKLLILIYVLFSIYIYIILNKNFKYYMFTIKQILSVTFKYIT